MKTFRIGNVTREFRNTRDARHFARVFGIPCAPSLAAPSLAAPAPNTGYGEGELWQSNLFRYLPARGSKANRACAIKAITKPGKFPPMAAKKETVKLVSKASPMIRREGEGDLAGKPGYDVDVLDQFYTGHNRKGHKI
jgi:hypothetical protein